MSHVAEVAVERLPPERFEPILSGEGWARFSIALQEARLLLEGRVVYNVNSTARGGGVAEMLRSLLAYARGAQVDARWLVIDGNPEFFRVTKRLHNHLHGFPGDGGVLGPDEQLVYETTLRHNIEELLELVRPDDVVLLHDPQTAGLTEALSARGARVVWRCHVGLDTPNDLARRAWSFLEPHVEQADAYIFSRRAFAWEGLDHGRIHIIPPSIDAFSPKNQAMDDTAVAAILDATGIVPGGGSHPATFIREDGSPGRVDRLTRMYDGGPAPPPGAHLVVQVSRWDRLKDPLGVLRGFARHIAPETDAHLVLAGPSVEAVTDDPEGAEVLDEVGREWGRLPPGVAARAHLACLPMEDGEENAAIVNALQRRADVVVQKSLAEGFGLTVAEAMWKARPVVASRIGGIQDQIVHGTTGLLLRDPNDLAAFGGAVGGLLGEPDRALHMGREAEARVRAEFLGPRHLIQYLELVRDLLG